MRPTNTKRGTQKRTDAGIRLTKAQRAELYILTQASVHAALVKGKATRQKPAGCAQLAREHAEAALRDYRIVAHVKREASKKGQARARKARR